MPTLVIDGVAHEVSGAHMAILDGGRVLVQFRPLPPGWELPGGHCDPGEDPAECAVRETAEETGLTVSITGLVGVYQWAGLRHAGDALYVGVVTGGTRRRTPESWRVRHVGVEQLPRTLFPWFRDRIADALDFEPGRPPVFREQRVARRHVLMFGLVWLARPVDGLLGWLRRR